MNRTPNSNGGLAEIGQHRAGAVDTGIALADNVLAIAREVGEMLSNVPYVKALSGVIIQIIRIRNEIEANEKRCHQIIQKVLRTSTLVCEKLKMIALSNQRDKLYGLADYLNKHTTTLTAIHTALEKHRSRTRFSRFVNRGLDDLNEHDQRLDELRNELILDVIFFIAKEQAASDLIPSQLTPAGNDLSFFMGGGLDHVLPSKPPLMVGCDDHFRIAREGLLKENPTRIAILGGGGFGKTTLARTILHDPDIAERYEARYFLSCEDVLDVPTLLSTFGTVLGIKANLSAMIACARRMLATSATLLCLDSFEIPWEPPATRAAVESVLQYIADIPTVSLIITTRGTQRPGKVEWSNPLLKPLSTLSLDSAKLILKSIAADHVVDEYTEKLLKAIDGIPLAVTLIANLLRDGEPSPLLWSRWLKTQIRTFANGGGHDSNLYDSILLSVESRRMKQDEDSKTLLAALCLLPDGFLNSQESRTLLENHLGISNGIATPLEILRTVALISLSTGSENTPSRFQMLSPIRLFCQEYLSQSHIPYALRSMVNYYIEILLQAKDRVEDSEYYAKIVPEIHNIHSVFQREYCDRPTQQAVVRNIHSVFQRLHPDDFLHHLVEASCSLSNWSRYIGYSPEQTLKLALQASQDVPILRADCLMALGHLYFWEGRLEEGEVNYREAAYLYKKKKSLIGEVNALDSLGALLVSRTGELDEAEQTLWKSRALYKKANIRHGEANADCNLGRLYMEKEQYLYAEASFTRALDIYKEIKDALGETNACNSLANLHQKNDDLPKAKRFAEQALEASKETQYALGKAHALHTLGCICLMNDRVQQARARFDEARGVFKALKFTSGELTTINLLSSIEIQENRLDEATERLEEATRCLPKEPSILSSLGWAYIRGNQLDRATEVLQKSKRLYQKSNDKQGEADVLAELAIMYLKDGNLEESEEALASIQDLGVYDEIEMRRLCTLGEIYIQHKRFPEAEAALKSALDSSIRSHSSYQQGIILRNMGTLELDQGNVDAAIQKFEEAHKVHAQWAYEQGIDQEHLEATRASLATVETDH